MKIRTGKTFGIPIGPQPKVREKVLFAPVFYHEMGDDYSDSDMTNELEVPPSQQATKIVMRSVVLTPLGRQKASPAYLASQRRRKTQSIAQDITALSRHAEDEQFALWTEKVVERIRNAIQFLCDEEETSDSPCESNSCEVLRQIRDSFLNGGWEKYRRADARNAALGALKRLSSQDEVSGDEVNFAFNELLKADLDGAVFPIQTIFTDDDEEIPD
ncbi:MAG: hypothetical protein ACKV2Q_18500 [Planctomycetaceae bacterium]